MTVSTSRRGPGRGRRRPAPAGKEEATRRRFRLAPYLFVSPFYIIFVAFFLGPTLFALYLSFTRWTAVGSPEFRGLDNYERLLTDNVFLQSIVNTVVYSAASLFIVVPLALVLALALNSERLWFKKFWRSAYFAPIVTSTVAVSLTFLTLYNRNFGPLNGLLSTVGLDPVDWLGNRRIVRLSIIGVIVWKWTGLTALYFLAGLQSVRQDLHEAAIVDGANSWQRFWNVTVPQLRPVIVFVSVIVTIGSLQIFDEPQVLTGGGPANASISVVQYLFSRGIGGLRFGYASAIGTLLFAVIFILSIFQLRIFRRSVDEA